MLRRDLIADNANDVVLGGSERVISSQDGSSGHKNVPTPGTIPYYVRKNEVRPNSEC